MKAIYPNTASRTALTVFQIYKGSGEFFDLSQKPVFRERFSFGGMENHMQYFFVTDKCNGCECCVKICPQNCIDISSWKMYGNMPLAGNRKEDSMTQAERLTFLIEYLMSENKELKSFHIPVEENAKKRLLRSLNDRRFFS